MNRIYWSLLLLLIVPVRGYEAAPGTLRVLTYNIHHGEGRDGRFDLPRLADIMKNADPDLVALQEVDQHTERADGVDQLAELERLTEMHGAFGKAMDYQGGNYGVAVLSRWPIQSAMNRPLPGSPEIEPRTALTVEVRAGAEGPLLQFTTAHFDNTRADDRQAQAMYLDEVLVREARATILAGDMNARPDTDVMKVFEPRWTIAPSADASPGVSTGRPRLRGDYVLFRPSERWRVIESRTIDETVASDHRPLLVVLEWIGMR
jgi:endonuclease/exonuclease/phosphatase family metal-dependent hydrolase